MVATPAKMSRASATTTTRASGRRATADSACTQYCAMDIDETTSPALYFGTTTGQLWIGRDGGEQFECLFDALPPIHCVKVAVV